MLRRLIAVVFFAICIVLAARVTFCTIFSGFNTYDDEGAIIVALLGLARGHVLYDQVAGMYGPFGFFPKLAIIKAFHLAVDHNVSRTMSWTTYFAGCVTASLVTWRFTKQASLAAITLFVTYLLLRWFGGESGHPQDECQLLLSIAALLATFAIESCRWRVGIAIAVVGGMLLMTKGNLGVFFIAAFGTTLVLLLRKSTLRLILRIACLMALLILPWTLLRSHVDNASVSNFFIAIEISLLNCFLIATMRATHGALRLREVLLFATCLLATAGIIFAGTMALGTSLRGMKEGLIDLPLRGSNLFFWFWRKSEWMIPVAVFASVGAAIGAAYLRKTDSKDAQFPVALAVFRMAGGIYVAKVALFDSQSGQELLMATLPPFLWIFMMPIRFDIHETPVSFARTFIAFLAVAQTMGSYPNAGTQQAIGLIIPMIIAVVSFNDGLQFFLRFLPTTAIRLNTVIGTAVGCFILWFSISTTVRQDRIYQRFVPLSLPGSDMVRVPDQELLRLKMVVAE
ncbi:MAG: hypothetical protein JO353_01910, partial [Phycisphaerae bacterium]|nr:hypothetical protein [Phycisphaerae bacterium]